MSKEKWECSNNKSMFGEESSSRPLTWPQRNYTCSFCKRQFNSAQALGGHMNVHRRDRARLRQLPSWVLECHQNPKPSFPSSTSLSPYLAYKSATTTTSFTPFYKEKKPRVDECHRSEVLSPQPEDLAKKKNMRAEVEVGEFNQGLANECELKALKTSDVISLELEMGCKDSKEVLDLELRLGCF